MDRRPLLTNLRRNRHFSTPSFIVTFSLTTPPLVAMRRNFLLRDHVNAWGVRRPCFSTKCGRQVRRTILFHKTTQSMGIHHQVAFHQPTLLRIPQGMRSGIFPYSGRMTRNEFNWICHILVSATNKLKRRKDYNIGIPGAYIQQLLGRKL